MELSLELPINSVSFGQCSIALLREFFAMGLEPNLFVIGAVDVSSQNIQKDFESWLNSCVRKAMSRHKRKTPTFKLWHINDSLKSLSNEQNLLTFYELDSPTPEEINILSNQKKVLVTSNYTKRVFEDHGLNNIEYVSLGFDKYNFFRKDKMYFLDGRITFNLLGKFEKRKHHAKIVQAWCKKYGNNPKYQLQCAVYNPFNSLEENKANFTQAVNNQRIDNVQFLGFMQQNEAYNDFLNSGDIVLGVSGGEGLSVGDLTSVALGKHAVILNAHAYKDWANDSNAILVNPSGKIEAYDGKFFQKGQPFNQGNIFDFNEEEFLAACDKAIERYKVNNFNTAGVELQNTHDYAKAAKQIIDSL